MIDSQIEYLIARYKTTTFKWGVFDCAQFAAKAMLKIHGLKIELPTYSSEREALRVLRSKDGLHNCLDDIGLERFDASTSQRGDLLVIKNDDAWGYALALNVGNGAACPADVGLKIVGRDRWVGAWRPSCHS